MLVYRLLRVAELCDGGADGPRGCPDANDIVCGKCGLVREVDDTNAPGACPHCGAWQFTVKRCRHCKLDDLDHARRNSPSGALFERILELEFDVAHFSVPWHEVTAEEVRGLQILKEERDRLQREQQQQNPHGVQK